MKVNLAAQFISSSVANALYYCDTVLQLPQFKDCNATIMFLKVFDGLFDILNSRNPTGKGLKASMSHCNVKRWMEILNDAKSYILTLRDKSGKLVLNGNKTTGVIGFLHALTVSRIFFMN